MLRAASNSGGSCSDQGESGNTLSLGGGGGGGGGGKRRGRGGEGEGGRGGEGVEGVAVPSAHTSKNNGPYFSNVF